MIEAGLAWLLILGFEVVQTLRGRPTLSQAAWTLGRSRRWLKWLVVGLVAALAVHLLVPAFTHDSPPTAATPPPDAAQECPHG